MTPENTHALLFWIVDRVFIGLLLLGVAYAFNRLLERSKARLAFGNEMAKQRVTRIGEVWSALNELEASNEQLLRKVSLVTLKRGTDRAALTELMPLQDASNKKAELVRQIAGANRFWLGETLYEKIQSY